MTPEAIDAYRSGQSLRQLADKFGFSPGYWRAFLMRNGVILRPPGGASRKAQKSRRTIQRLSLLGHSPAEIARQVGLSRQRVWVVLRDAEK